MAEAYMMHGLSAASPGTSSSSFKMKMAVHSQTKICLCIKTSAGILVRRDGQVVDMHKIDCQSDEVAGWALERVLCPKSH